MTEEATKATDKHLIVVIDGKHLIHDWAMHYEVGNGGTLELFSDVRRPKMGAGQPKVVYRNWDFIYWGASKKDMPKRAVTPAPGKPRVVVLR